MAYHRDHRGDYQFGTHNEERRNFNGDGGKFYNNLRPSPSLPPQFGGFQQLNPAGGSHGHQMPFSQHKSNLTFSKRNNPFAAQGKFDVGARIIDRSSKVAQCTLYFGGATVSESLVGGCAWSIIDSNNRRIAYGSYSVQQNFPSQTRLEYEGLLNGLQACVLKNICNITVKGCCSLAISHYSQDKRFSMLGSMYHSVEDLDSAIRKVLPRFQSCEFALIPAELNTFVIRLAEGAIKTQQRKDEIKIEKLTANTVVDVTSSVFYSMTPSTLSSTSSESNDEMDIEFDPNDPIFTSVFN